MWGKTKGQGVETIQNIGFYLSQWACMNNNPLIFKYLEEVNIWNIKSCHHTKIQTSKKKYGHYFVETLFSVLKNWLKIVPSHLNVLSQTKLLWKWIKKRITLVPPLLFFLSLKNLWLCNFELVTFSYKNFKLRDKN